MAHADIARHLGGQSWLLAGADQRVGVVRVQGLRLEARAVNGEDRVPGIAELDARDPRVGAWTQARASNPALHDGPIWTVDSAALEPHSVLEVVLRPDRYWRLALGAREPEVAAVRLLGVKACIVGNDRNSRPHVLIARRAHWVRAYPGQWEICPAGGVDVGPDLLLGERLPAGGTASGLPAAILRTLDREMREELALERADRLRDEQVIAAAFDDHAASLDVIIGATWRAVVDPRRGLCDSSACGPGGAGESEYSDLAWVARDDLPGFVRRHSAAISAVTRAVWLALGWIEEADAGAAKS